MSKDTLGISNVVDDLWEAKTTALSLIDNKPIDIDEMFEYKNLEMVEIGIKELNSYSDKCWLLSSILLYSLVYDKQMYAQSGLSWEEYVNNAKERLGMSRRDISDNLISARFFIKHHKALKRAGWNPNGSSRKLISAEYAYALSGDLSATIKHLCKDTWQEFKLWYSSFKSKPALPPDVRPDIVINKSKIIINGIEAVTVSKDIPEKERVQIELYLEKIFSAIKQGDIPAIVPVYDEKEAKALIRLRDKNRQVK